MSDSAPGAVTWADVLALVARLDEGGLADAEVTTQGVSIRVARHALPSQQAVVQPAAAAAPAAAATPVMPSAPVEEVDTAEPSGPEITAPMLGVLYLRPSPDAAPFVAVGDTVVAGATVAVIEVMKMMNTVVADVGGRVTEICRPEGQMVEHGDVLIRLAAEG